MSNKKKVTMVDIRARKNKLKSDLDLLESDFQNRYFRMKGNILGSLQPLTLVKKNPIKAVGSAVLLGLAIGLAVPKRSSKSNKNSSESTSFSPGFTSLLFDEAKRIAARKAAYYVSDIIDKKISSED